MSEYVFEGKADLVNGIVLAASDELSDITRKWGFRYSFQKYGFEHMCIFQTSAWGIEPELTITSDIRPDRQAVFVDKGTNACGFQVFGGSGDQKSVIFLLPARQFEDISPTGLPVIRNLQEGQFIIERNILPSDLVTAITKIDEKAAQKDLVIEKGSKIRKPLDEFLYIQPDKFHVDEVFAKKGSLYPVLPGQDIEEIREMFDHPDNLLTISDPYSGRVMGFGHVRDSEYFDKSSKVINDVLIEYDLTMEEFLTVLGKSPRILTPIIEKIKREQKKLL